VRTCEITEIGPLNVKEAGECPIKWGKDFQHNVIVNIRVL